MTLTLIKNSVSLENSMIISRIIVKSKLDWIIIILNVLFLPRFFGHFLILNCCAKMTRPKGNYGPSEADEKGKMAKKGKIWPKDKKLIENICIFAVFETRNSVNKSV